MLSHQGTDGCRWGTHNSRSMVTQGITEVYGRVDNFRKGGDGDEVDGGTGDDVGDDGSLCDTPTPQGEAGREAPPYSYSLPPRWEEVSPSSPGCFMAPRRVRAPSKIGSPIWWYFSEISLRVVFWVVSPYYRLLKIRNSKNLKFQSDAKKFGAFMRSKESPNRSPQPPRGQVVWPGLGRVGIVMIFPKTNCLRKYQFSKKPKTLETTMTFGTRLYRSVPKSMYTLYKYIA